jgi:hypothetical protein
MAGKVRKWWKLVPSLQTNLLTDRRELEATDNSWDKSDPKDAQVLLHLLWTGVIQHYQDPFWNQIHNFQELSLTSSQIYPEKPRSCTGC